MDELTYIAEDTEPEDNNETANDETANDDDTANNDETTITLEEILNV
jgi:hypothetical protein